MPRLIREAGDHLLALVNDILDVTQLEPGQLALEEAPFDPRAEARRRRSSCWRRRRMPRAWR